MATRWIARRMLVAAPLLAFFTSCAVDQKKEVASYRKIIDADLPAVTEPAGDEPLTLQQAFVMANRLNENLGLRGEAYIQALIQRDRVFANFLPTVSFQPNFSVAQTTSHGSSIALGPTGTGIGIAGVGSGQFASLTGTSAITPGTGSFVQGAGVAHRFEAPVVANINLFRGFADVNNLKVIDRDIEQQRQLLLDAQAALLLDVAQAYYQVLRSEQQVDVLVHNLELQQARVSDMDNRLRNGLARRLDLAQAIAQADATRVTLVQAQGDVQNGRSILAFLIGAELVKGPLSDTFAVPADPGPESRYEAEARNTRQDLRAAQAAVEAFRFAVQSSMAEYYPSVSLNVAGFLYRENFSDATKWDSILSANLPIFAAGLIQADVRNSWSSLRQAALAESLLRRQIHQDVRTSYQNLLTSEKRIRELQGEVDASLEAYRQSRDQYAVGLARNLDVLTAQDQLLSAQLQLANAAFDRTISYLDLMRITGRLTPRFPNERTLAATTLPSSRIAGRVVPVTTAPATLPSAPATVPLNFQLTPP